MLVDISEKTKTATEKKTVAAEKALEIEEANKVVFVAIFF